MWKILFHFQYKYLKIRKQRKQDEIFVIIGENHKEIKIFIQTKCTLQWHLAVKREEAILLNSVEPHYLRIWKFISDHKHYLFMMLIQNNIDG